MEPVGGTGQGNPPAPPGSKKISIRQQIEQIQNGDGSQKPPVTVALTGAVEDGMPMEQAIAFMEMYYDMLEVIGQGDFLPQMNFNEQVTTIIESMGRNPELALQAMRDMMSDVNTERDQQLRVVQERARQQEWSEQMDITTRQTRLMEETEARQARNADRTARQRQAEGLVDVQEAIDTSQRGYASMLGDWAQRGTLVPSTPDAYYGGAQVYADLARDMNPDVVAEPRQIGGPIEVPDLAEPFAQAKQAIEESVAEVAASRGALPAPPV